MSAADPPSLVFPSSPATAAATVRARRFERLTPPETPARPRRQSFSPPNRNPAPGRGSMGDLRP